MTRTRLLFLLVLATALPIGGCYVDAGPPPPPGYYGHAPPPPGYWNSYEWRGRPPPPR